MKPIQSNEEIDAIVERLYNLRLHKKQVAKEEDNLMQLIYNYMNEHEELVSQDGEVLLTWKYSKDSEYFDVKRFAIDNAETYNKYITSREGARRLVIK